MKIKVPWVDGRTATAQFKVYVLNEETGEEIGHVENRRGATYTLDGDTKRTPSRFITLLDKYTGHFETHEECVAFAKGVEAVINRVV